MEVRQPQTRTFRERRDVLGTLTMSLLQDGEGFLLFVCDAAALSTRGTHAISAETDILTRLRFLATNAALQQW